MKNITVKDIISICKGHLICGDEDYICENFCKDTRVIQNGDVYVGIKGENFDGNILYKEAIDKGAKVCILQDVEIDKNFLKDKDVNIILVEDTIKAIGEIANYKRNLYGKEFLVVAITGSVGKTSTKDIIASVISKEYKVLKTKGNMNNHIGLPFTILQLRDEQALVVEMGMNHFGEIEYLTKIAQPNIAVITNIGTSHIGNLGSRENILKAKLEILKSRNIKHLVINNDNDLLNKWFKENKKDIKVHTYAIQNNSQIMAKNIKFNEQSSEFECEFGKEKINLIVPVGGEHFIYNSLCAVTIGKILNIQNNKIIDGIKNFELTKKRMEIVKVKDDVTIINDSYNASYDSIKASLEYLKSLKGNRKIAVLGDMLELGNFAEELHTKVGSEVANNNIDILITVGKDAKYINKKVEELSSKIKSYHFNSNKEAADYLNTAIKKEDVILLKASNGMKFFEILENIK